MPAASAVVLWWVFSTPVGRVVVVASECTLAVFVRVVGRGGLCVGASSFAVVVVCAGVGVVAAVGDVGSLEGAFECSTCSFWSNSSPEA